MKQMLFAAAFAVLAAGPVVAQTVQPAQPAPGIGGTPGQAADPLSLTRLDDRDVYGLSGEEVGEVEEIVLGPGNRVYAAIEIDNGFLGLGEATRLVAVDQLRVVDGRIQLPLTQAQIEALPEWRRRDRALRAFEWR